MTKFKISAAVTRRNLLTIAAIAALGACATTPEIREIEGPIVLDAPDSVVRSGGSVTPAPVPTAQPLPDDGAEIVTSVPVTPITCPAGSSPQPDGSCMLLN